MIDFVSFLEEVSAFHSGKLHLITTLQPKSFDQIRKISSLVSLIEFPGIKENKIQCKISLNNRLHGKIYIFKNDNEYLSAIISSANFTEAGLSKNHEWGIEITDEDKIIELENSILDSIEYESLSSEDIYTMQEKANDFLMEQPQKEERKIALILTDYISSSDWKKPMDDNIDYWLKPIGSTDEPVEEGKLFMEEDTTLNFSRRRPNSVKPNDILIAYGVGSSKIIGIYNVTSFPLYVSPEQIKETEWFGRWPWYVTCQNRTPNFGGRWWTHNLHINGLKDKYLKKHPDKPITAVGGRTLGALNYGHDKLRLSPDFARFIIEEVTKCDSL